MRWWHTQRSSMRSKKAGGILTKFLWCVCVWGWPGDCCSMPFLVSGGFSGIQGTNQGFCGFFLLLTGWGWGCAGGCMAGDGAGFKCVLLCLCIKMQINKKQKYPKMMYEPNSGSWLQDLISPVGLSLENTPVLSVCQYSLPGVAKACLLGVYGLSW